MPRDIPVEIEASFDSQQSADAVAYFVSIVHPKLPDAVRMVSSPYGDNIGNHVLAGTLYNGIPFNLTIASDDDRIPRGRLEMLNFGFVFGEAVIAMRTKPLLTIEAYAARDFTVATSGAPPAHQPIGTPRRLYRAAWLTIVNVKGETWLSGDIAPYGPDPSGEPASPMRATQDKFPGIYR